MLCGVKEFGTMSIRKWHFGKLIILWSWGTVLSALVLTRFMTHPTDPTILLACELAFVVLTLVTLSVVTWCWLGSKESG